MASVIRYTHVPRRFCDGTLDWDTDTFKMALVTSSYTPSAAHTIWGDVSANEVASGNGYTTGGVALAGKALTNTMLDCNDPSWTALSKTFRYAVVYKVGTAGPDSLVNPLVCYIDFGSNTTATGTDFVVTIDAGGLMTLGGTP